MKSCFMKFVLPIFLFFVTHQCFAHAFYFGFAELEYNEFNQCIEGAVVLTTHDVEVAIEHDTGKHLVLSDSMFKINENKRILDQFISNGLQFLGPENALYQLDIEGLAVSLTGLVTFYFKTEPIRLNTCKVLFPMLMPHFPDQQNKVTFILRDKKETFNFIRPDTVHTLNLSYD